MIRHNRLSLRREAPAGTLADRESQSLTSSLCAELGLKSELLLYNSSPDELDSFYSIVGSFGMSWMTDISSSELRPAGFKPQAISLQGFQAEFGIGFRISQPGMHSRWLGLD